MKSLIILSLVACFCMKINADQGILDDYMEDGSGLPMTTIQPEKSTKRPTRQPTLPPYKNYCKKSYDKCMKKWYCPLLCSCKTERNICCEREFNRCARYVDMGRYRQCLYRYVNLCKI
ncbi:uncharacterized protein [Clytia hemisphaerica]|uniref:Uncharacterized protein n=1 Tax=Clytia hemisphaerica TaxID=252671 RepID=A0A7M5VBL7_9CNID|eukprot:TCONS_00000733-protein